MTTQVPELLKLLYVSTAARPLDDRDLDALLAVARSRNAASDITGVLLYADGRFLQHLEGRDADVEAVFASIEADPRHEDVRVLTRRPIGARQFADWSMGFGRPDATRFAARSVELTGAEGLFHEHCPTA